MSVELVFLACLGALLFCIGSRTMFPDSFFPYDGFFKSGFSQPAGSIELGFLSGFFFFFLLNELKLLVLYLEIFIIFICSVRKYFSVI